MAQLGVKMFGLSPDGPQAYAATAAKFELPYTRCWVTLINRHRALWFAFSKMRKPPRNTPLVADADGAFHLPVPAVYLIDKSG